PQWINDAMDCFKTLDAKLYPGWSRVVEAWVNFEKSGTFDNKVSLRLPCKHRPEEIKHWISRGRRYDRLPIVKSTAQYASAWKAWWISMQPLCRMPEGGAAWPPRSITPKAAGQWDSLRVGGTNGIFIVVVSLAIW
ncbi:hypothetical protein C8Q73DRAFT_624379, partial [Cubamyces lactineus]